VGRRPPGAPFSSSVRWVLAARRPSRPCAMPPTDPRQRPPWSAATVQQARSPANCPGLSAPACCASSTGRHSGTNFGNSGPRETCKSPYQLSPLHPFSR